MFSVTAGFIWGSCLSVFGRTPITMFFYCCTYIPPAHTLTKDIPCFQLASNYNHQFTCSCGKWNRNLNKSPLGLTKDQILISLGKPNRVSKGIFSEDWVYKNSTNELRKRFCFELTFLGDKCITYHEVGIFHGAIADHTRHSKEA